MALTAPGLASGCSTAPWWGLPACGPGCRGVSGFPPQTYSQLAHPIQQAKALGLQFHSRILDIDNIDVSVSWVAGAQS